MRDDRLPHASTSDGSRSDLPASAGESEPVFLGSEAVDQLAGMVLTLGAELAAVSSRLRRAELRLDAAGLTSVPEVDVDADVDAQVDALVARLLGALRSDATHGRPLDAQRNAEEEAS